MAHSNITERLALQQRVKFRVEGETNYSKTLVVEGIVICYDIDNVVYSLFFPDGDHLVASFKNTDIVSFD